MIDAVGAESESVEGRCWATGGKPLQILAFVSLKQRLAIATGPLTVAHVRQDTADVEKRPKPQIEVSIRNLRVVAYRIQKASHGAIKMMLTKESA